MTLAVNYVGNESHFIVNSGNTGANARGYWTNQVDPKYLAVLGRVTGQHRKHPAAECAGYGGQRGRSAR